VQPVHCPHLSCLKGQLVGLPVLLRNVPYSVYLCVDRQGVYLCCAAVPSRPWQRHPDPDSAQEFGLEHVVHGQHTQELRGTKAAPPPPGFLHAEVQVRGVRTVSHIRQQAGPLQQHRIHGCDHRIQEAVKDTKQVLQNDQHLTDILGNHVRVCCITTEPAPLCRLCRTALALW